ELNESRLKTYDTLLNTVQFTNLTNQKKKAALKYDLLKKNIELLMETTDNSSYPKPISDYINYLNNMKNRYEQKNVNNIASYIRDEIIMGKYEIDEKDNSVSFRQKFGKNRYRKERIPFHVVSSSIKSLYGLDYYLENSSKEGDYLIIDEPELSLHPENQVKLAKVITDIVESKIKLITSTHSDLFVRELTNIVIENKLNSKNNKKNKLSDKNIGIYNFVGNNDINELEKISNISYYDNFDDVNYDLQERYNDLIEELEERGE
ncbi:TPA: AAA family ATPase, partial [Enterococcus faecium]